MGLLVDGQWHTDWYETQSTGGKFIRKDSAFRNWITPDGSAGPTGEAGFIAEAGRYHLYVAAACPWAHRTLIFRELKGLQNMISISVVNTIMREEGWTFAPGVGVIPDTINQKSRLYEIYCLANSSYTGRVTVPILWDKKKQTIVSNESSEIIRMLNSAFEQLGAKPGDYYPKDKRELIDALNEQIYHKVNNGVYKAGFATTQMAYEEAVTELFNELDHLEERLSKQRYLLGSQITEADWRLFTTLIRFDAVYVGHFKCNIKRIEDYPALSNYLRDLYQQPGIANTINFEQVKAHYYGSHETINPTLIVPKGPELDFMRAHNRGSF
ncbi:MAG: glutathione S-transferase family protein [Pseudomonadota bacterium]